MADHVHQPPGQARPTDVDLVIAVSASDAPAVTARPTGMEEAWIARLRALDPAALDELARREAGKVARLLHRLLGPRDDVEDLVQTVFLEACRALPSFRGESSAGTFLGAIAVRVARRAMRPGASVRRRGPMPSEPPAPEAGPHRNAVATEQMRRLRVALARIAPKKRIAFALWAFEGMAPERIAEITGASLSATRSRIYYAQKELRALAARDDYLREFVGGGGEDGVG